MQDETVPLPKGEREPRAPQPQPTNPDDPAHLAALEAETAAAAQAENDALRLALAPYVGCAVLVPLACLAALLSAMFGRNLFPNNSNLLAWAVIEAPLLVYAALVFRRGRIKLRSGRVYQGWIVRAAAAVAVSLAVFWVQAV